MEIKWWFFLFGKTAQTLKTEYKYGQYCTPLTQSDCRYFFALAISSCYRTVPSAIWEIFSEFLISCNLFCEPLDEWNNSKIWETRKIFANIVRGSAITTLSLNACLNKMYQELSLTRKNICSLIGREEYNIGRICTQFLILVLFDQGRLIRRNDFS